MGADEMNNHAIAAHKTPWTVWERNFDVLCLP